MTLGQKQQAFVTLVGKLIAYVGTTPNWALTFGEAFRTAEQAAWNAKAGTGIAKSLHTQRLAIDLNFFVDGVYQRDSAAYLVLGTWWEQQSTPDLTCCWGGRFSKPDGNHFSVEHEGVK